MAMRTVRVDGQDHVVVTERSSSDGGVVVCFMSPLADGTHASLRAWFQDPSLAVAELQNANVQSLRDKRALILDMIGATG